MEKQFTVLNPDGIHARPANAIVETASSFSSRIEIKAGAKTANAKSMISLLKLGAKMGDSVTIVAEGEDESEAIAAVGRIVESSLE